MNDDGIDARRVANLILDRARSLDIEISHVKLQKLLYFAHGLFLLRNKKPLVLGNFEAWQYGPVHPVVYRCFKITGGQAITQRATAIEPLSGRPIILDEIRDPVVVSLVDTVLVSLGRLSSGQLISLSHTPKGPWHAVVASAKAELPFGMRIGDYLISALFQHHKLDISAHQSDGESREDRPFTSTRPSAHRAPSST
jgi:uncharacterized phage-associated protein